MTAMLTTRVLLSPCPYCGAPNDAATSLESGTPNPGDVSICLFCTSILVFADDLRQRVMTPQEWDELDEADREKIRVFRRGILRIDRTKGPTS